MTYNKYYGNNLNVRQLDDIGHFLTSEIGYAIIAVSIILGTWLLGSGLFIYATKNPNDDTSRQTAIKKIIMGGLLITFNIVIGAIITTMKSSLNN